MTTFNRTQYIEKVNARELYDESFKIGMTANIWKPTANKFIEKFKNQPNANKYFRDLITRFTNWVPKRNVVLSDKVRNGFLKTYTDYENKFQNLLIRETATNNLLAITPDYKQGAESDIKFNIKEYNSYVTQQFTNQAEINKDSLPNDIKENLPMGYIQKLDAYNSFVNQKQRNPLMNFNMNISDLLLMESNPTKPITKLEEQKEGFIKQQNTNAFFKPLKNDEADLGEYIIRPLEKNIKLSRDERNNYIVSYQGKTKVFKPMEKNQAKEFIYNGAFESDKVTEYRKNQLYDFGFKKRIPGKAFVTY